MQIRLLVLAAVLVGGCKRKAPEGDGPLLPVSSVDDRVQVVLVTPGEVPANTSTPVTVIGTGFARGAEIRIGESWVQGVQYRDPSTLGATAPALPDGRYDVMVQNEDGSTGTLWSGLIVGTGGRDPSTLMVNRACRSVSVYFDSDGAGLDGEAERALSGEAACYAALEGRVKIEGHADERGTTDYNLALGQRRAEAVRRYLSRAGLPLHQMATVSLGEEQPEDPGHDESAWARNRRVVVQPE